MYWTTIFCLLGAALAQEKPAFALRHSFEPPYDKKINFWNAGAGAFVNETFVRITPAKQSRTGYLWNAAPSTMKDWEVTVEYHVSGRVDLGGDGFALWYVDQPEMVGTVFGSADYWSGLGIFFDTFNNDGLMDNPFVTVVVNDGSMKYDANSDAASQALASCSPDMRNLDKTSFARLRYKDNTLTLDIASSRDPRDNSPLYQRCFQVEDVELGVDKYFGVTAHTGDVADNHDIYSWHTVDLSPDEVDLAAVRARYREKINEQYSAYEEQDMELTQEEFQHHALTLLFQMQSALNLMEVSQIAIGDYLHSKLDSTLPGQAVPRTTPNTSTIPPNSKSGTPAAAAGTTGASSADIKVIKDSVTGLGQKLMKLQAGVTDIAGLKSTTFKEISTSVKKLESAVQRIETSVKSGGAPAAATNNNKPAAPVPVANGATVSEAAFQTHVAKQEVNWKQITQKLEAITSNLKSFDQRHQKESVQAGSQASKIATSLRDILIGPLEASNKVAISEFHHKVEETLNELRYSMTKDREILATLSPSSAMDLSILGLVQTFLLLIITYMVYTLYSSEKQKNRMKLY